MKCNCKVIRVEWRDDNENVYACHITEQTIPEGAELKFVGPHKPNKTNADATGIRFHSCNMTKFPQGLSKIFPNLQFIDINNSKIKEIKNEDLIEYKSLKMIIFQSNLIQILPDDLFNGLEENLEGIDFSHNKLTVIEPTILDGFADGQLIHVNFSENPRYTKYFSYSQNSNATLEEVKDELFEKYYSDINNLRKLNQLLKQQREETETLKATEELKTFHLDMKNFAQKDENLKDFTIKIEGKEFLVHKFVINARSPTLAEILSNNPDAESLSLTDISVEVFERILKYFYYDELPNEDDTDLLDLFAISGRLQINGLKYFAAEKLESQLNPENALKIFRMSNKYEDESLREVAFAEIKEMYPDFEFLDDWSTDVETVEKVLEILNEKKELNAKLDEKLESFKK